MWNIRTVSIGITSCCLVPILNTALLLEPNGTLSSTELVGGLQFPPPDSVFLNGLLSPSSMYCAGTVPQNRTSMSLCKALDFSVAYGNLLRSIVAMPMVNGLTFPVIVMLFGLPFRLYLATVFTPMLGMIYQAIAISTTMKWVEELGNTTSPTQSFNGVFSGGSAYSELVYYLTFAIVVYGTCIASTLSSERYTRSLFSIRHVLHHRRAALVSQRDKTR